MTEAQVKNAVEKFEALIRAQSDRSDKIKTQGDFTDFKALDKIIIGVCGGDGIGPVITKESARVLEYLLDDKVKAGKIEFKVIDGLTIENRVKANKAIPDDVLEELKRNGWLYGGESSGHILALDRQTTGDGIVSALQVLSAMRRSGRSLAELTADLQLLPQVLVNKRISAGYDWQNDRDFSRTVEACRTEVEGRGRVLIRPSGTEPLLRIMVEADDAHLAAELTSRMAESLSVEHQA